MSHFESTNVIPYGNIIWHINRYWLQRVRLETELIWPNFASTGSSRHYEVDLEVPETIYLLSRSSRILSLRNSCLINALSCAAPKFRSLAHPASLAFVSPPLTCQPVTHPPHTSLSLPHPLFPPLRSVFPTLCVSAGALLMFVVLVHFYSPLGMWLGFSLWVKVRAKIKVWVRGLLYFFPFVIPLSQLCTLSSVMDSVISRLPLKEG